MKTLREAKEEILPSYFEEETKSPLQKDGGDFIETWGRGGHKISHTSWGAAKDPVSEGLFMPS